MKDVWLFDILDPTQRLKTASDQRKVYAPPRMLSSLREAIFFHPTFFSHFHQHKKKKIKWSSAVFQTNYITPASLLCWQIMHFIYQVRASMCPCVAYYSKLRTNCLTYSTSTNSTSVLCGWAGRAIIIYSHSGGNYSARLSVWSGDLRCILSSLKLKATGFNFWPSQKSLDGSMK